MATSDTLYTVQQILNRCYDDSSKTLHISTSNPNPNSDTRFTEQQIMNRVFNPATNVIATS